MPLDEIITALIPAHMFARYGKPLSADEKVAAAEALKQVRFLPGKDRVAVHAAVEAGAASCAGIAV